LARKHNINNIQIPRTDFRAKKNDSGAYPAPYYTRNFSITWPLSAVGPSILHLLNWQSAGLHEMVGLLKDVKEQGLKNNDIEAITNKIEQMIKNPSKNFPERKYIDMLNFNSDMILEEINKLRNEINQCKYTKELEKKFDQRTNELDRRLNNLSVTSNQSSGDSYPFHFGNRTTFTDEGKSYTLPPPEEQKSLITITMSEIRKGLEEFEVTTDVDGLNDIFKDAEKNYHSNEKEFLAVKNGIKKFEIYLAPQRFLVRTDNKNLHHSLNVKLVRTDIH
jgi:hypothetical protein